MWLSPGSFNLMLLALTLLLTSSCSLARTVTVDTDAPWPRPSNADIVELSEIVEGIEPGTNLYWEYIERICSKNAQLEPHLITPTAEGLEEIRSVALDVATGLVSDRLQSLVVTSLSLGAFSPSLPFYDTLLTTQDACTTGMTFIIIPGRVVKCSVDEALQAVGEVKASSEIFENSFVEDWEHEVKSGSVNSSTVRVILHGPVGTSSFCTAHAKLFSAAMQGDLSYTLRHHSGGLPVVTNRTRLRGYGVYLDIKNMEYKNVDDRQASEDPESKDASEINSDLTAFQEDEVVNGVVFSTLLKRAPELHAELKLLRESLIDVSSADKNGQVEMKVWKMRDLGLQTLQTVLTAQDPLKKMAQVIQNFPMHAPSISSLKVLSSVREDVYELWQKGFTQYMPINSIFLNGKRFRLDGATFNVFDFLNYVKDEFSQMASLDKMKLSRLLRNKLKDLALSLGDGEDDQSGMGNIVRIDASKGGKNAITFLNNLEKDEMYKRWPKSVRQLLYPSWSLHAIAKNLYTVIMVVDPLSENGAALLNQAQMIYSQTYPIRFGFTLSCKGLINIEVCKLFHFARETYSPISAVKFLFSLAETVEENSSQGIAAFTTDRIVEIFASSLLSSDGSKRSKIYTTEATAVIAESPSESAQQYIVNCSDYIFARGFPLNSFSLNGIVSTSPDLSSMIMQLLGREQFILSQLVQKGELTDKVKSVFNLVLQSTGGYSRFHPLLEDAEVVYSDFTSSSFLGDLKSFAFVDTGTPDSSGQYYIANTLIVFFSPSIAGVQLAKESLLWLQSQEDDIPKSRVSLVVNYSPSSQKCADNVCRSEDIMITRISQVFQAAHKSICTDHACIGDSAIKKMISVLEYLEAELLENALPQDANSEIVQVLEDSKTEVLNIGSIERVMRKSLDCGEDQSVVVYNARRILASDAPLTAEDFSLLADIEEKKVAAKLSTILTSNNGKSKYSADEILKMLSFVSRYSSSGSRHNIDSILQQMEFGSGSAFFKEILPKKKTVVNANGDLVEEEELEFSSSDDLSIYVIIDPLTIAAQRASSLMQIIRDQLRLPQNLILTPRVEVTEFPLQNFYRFVTGDTDEQSVATFGTLPRQHILTVRLDTPESWNVQAVRAEQDPDNLRCDSGGCGDRVSQRKDVSSVGYNLKSMLVVGQCYQMSDSAYGGVPPNGLQIVLSSSTSHTDTLVMQNLGYFQLQANPGLWKLSLAEGRATELFQIVDVDNVAIAVYSFTSDMKRLPVKKRPGFEDVSLLDDPKAQSTESTQMQGQKRSKSTKSKKSKKATNSGDETSMWNSISGLFSSKPVAKVEEENKIHVFSLATGHLYERLLRIMMLSVTKRSSMPVKFWLFENFLSPRFKLTASVMAEEYGFEVGYVTYKWPEWLTQQTQKQRIIWGYKILFLDVLFPLNVKKVIYVDADQVMRADLAELWRIDLKGKPYAYTPFCSSRKETLGFQFWRQGYWNDHLQGMPYHISALYVVDLQNFRRNAVGDQLRAIYNNLAKDPNSLANLDQDLPNYAQHSVPIHSLPQEWLWCETWCSEDSKSKAKTIDLCNSPLNKEPKLDMARRIISGKLFNESWVQLDEEISGLERRKGISE